MDGFEPSAQYACDVFCFQQNFWQKFNQYGLSRIRLVGKYRILSYEGVDHFVANVHCLKLRPAYKDENPVCSFSDFKRTVLDGELFLFADCTRHRHARENERRRDFPLGDVAHHLCVAAGDSVLLCRDLVRPIGRVRQIQRYQAPLRRVPDALDVPHPRVLFNRIAQTRQQIFGCNAIQPYVTLFDEF